MTARIPGPLGLHPYPPDTRIPGPQGLHPYPLDTKLPERSEFHWDRHRVPTADDSRGPVGLRVGPKSAGNKQPPQATAAKPTATALIIFGKGQMDMYEGVKIKNETQFKAGALDYFKDYTKGHKVEPVFVYSAEEMVEVIERQDWDVVIYLGHAYFLSKKLAPGYTENVNTGGLSEDRFAAALKKSSVRDVYMFGCRAGWTGLGRSLSKNLPGVNVGATFNDLDVDWKQTGTPTRKGGNIVNKFTMHEKITQYKNGFQMENGVKTKKRKMELGDPLPMDGNPLDEPMVSQ